MAWSVPDELVERLERLAAAGTFPSREAALEAALALLEREVRSRTQRRSRFQEVLAEALGQLERGDVAPLKIAATLAAIRVQTRSRRDPADTADPPPSDPRDLFAPETLAAIGPPRPDRILRTPRAQTDLVEALGRLEAESSAVADRFAIQLAERLEALAGDPGLAEPCEEIASGLKRASVWWLTLLIRPATGHHGTDGTERAGSGLGSGSDVAGPSSPLVLVRILRDRPAIAGNRGSSGDGGGAQRDEGSGDGHR